jgi:hypothetical protein
MARVRVTTGRRCEALTVALRTRVYWRENSTRSDMYAEIPWANIGFLLVKVSVMLIAPWMRGFGYTAYPHPRVVLKRCAL